MDKIFRRKKNQQDIEMNKQIIENTKYFNTKWRDITDLYNKIYHKIDILLSDKEISSEGKNLLEYIKKTMIFEFKYNINEKAKYEIKKRYVETYQSNIDSLLEPPTNFFKKVWNEVIPEIEGNKVESSIIKDQYDRFLQQYLQDIESSLSIVQYSINTRFYYY